MILDDTYAHICSAMADCSANAAMTFLTAPEKLASWAVGMGKTKIHEDDLIEGISPDTGEPIWARISPNWDHHTIYYHLGTNRTNLVPRIIIQIVPGDVLQKKGKCCIVSMIAWRQENMSNIRWENLKSRHETEIREVKRLVERD